MQRKGSHLLASPTKNAVPKNGLTAMIAAPDQNGSVSKHLKKADFEKQFEGFERSPKESLLSCITRLQYIIRCMLCDNTDAEKHVMEKQFLPVKLKKIIPKLVWQNIITLENTRLETGESFDLVHEIQIAEKSYDESFGKDLNSLNTSLQKLQTSSASKQNPSKTLRKTNTLLYQSDQSVNQQLKPRKSNLRTKKHQRTIQETQPRK